MPKSKGMSDMRVLALRFAAAFALALMALHATAAEPNRYESLLAQLKAGDTTIDFQALRYAYAETAQYHPYGNGGAAPDAFKALQAGDLDKALAEANEILATNYVSIDAHFVCAAVYNRRGDAVKAAFHKAIFQGLRDSIARSGDGKSPASAYVVISVDEEYAFLGIAGLRVTMQSLLHSDSGPVDAMSVLDAQQNAQTVHFNISRPFAALERSFTKPAQ